jgi:hypothetical protein
MGANATAAAAYTSDLPNRCRTCSLGSVVLETAFNEP